MNFSVLTDLALSFVRILGSTVAGPHGAVLEGGEGTVGALDDESAGEQFTDVEAYGALGLVVRPRPPETIDGEQLEAQGVAVRKGGLLYPLSRRDLRLNRRFPNPKPGSVALVGYGGGFLAFDDNGDKESVCTLYVPYDFNGAGVPQKAHTITVDPTGNAISLLHGDGGQFVLLPDKEAMLISDNSTWLKIKPGKIDMQAETVTMAATVIIGNPTTALALAGSTATLPSTRLLYSTT